MVDSALKCTECGGANLRAVTTYKRIWRLCSDCGTGVPTQRDRYPFAFLPHPKFKMPAGQDQQSIYDYFVDPFHIRYSIDTAHEFLAKHVRPNQIDLSGKRVLDVSGGNGHFIKEIEKQGAVVSLTEINKRAIEHAKELHGFNVYEFDFNAQRIHEIVNDTFDLVLLRAAIMFCRALKQLAQDLTKVVRSGGMVIVDHSVVPTLGVLLRVQLDEFSYASLRQPETVIKYFEQSGFKLMSRRDETDPSLYVYDHDVDRWPFLAHVLYEVKAIRGFKNAREFSFPARDRRRSTMIFQRQS